MSIARQKEPHSGHEPASSRRDAIAQAINKLRIENRRLKELVVKLTTIIAKRVARRK